MCRPIAPRAQQGVNVRPTKRFRDLVEAEEILVLPGIFDALSARLAAEAAFEAVVGGGYAAAASLIASSWGVASLNVAGIVGPGQFLGSWQTWWVGDLIEVSRDRTGRPGPEPGPLARPQPAALERLRDTAGDAIARRIESARGAGPHARPFHGEPPAHHAIGR